MTDDEIAYAASQAVMELEPGAVVLSVRRLPDKPFGWAVVFEGGGGARASVTFEHTAAEGHGSLKEKLKAAVAGRVS